MFLTCKNPLVYKENAIYFFLFLFVEDVTIIYWLLNMKPNLQYTVKSYEGAIVYYLGNSGTTDLLLHIVQCWHTCAADE